MSLEEEDPNKKLEMTIKVELNLDPEMFDKLYAHLKVEYGLEISKKKKPMAEMMKIIREFCDAFPEIRFDESQWCFYNEAEEIERLKEKHRKDKNDLKSALSTRRSGCDCCVIL